MTVLENWLREQGGEAGYQASFVAEFLLPILYPDDLTHEVQHRLGTLVVASIVSMYCWLWLRSRIALVKEESSREERTEM